MKMTMEDVRDLSKGVLPITVVVALMVAIFSAGVVYTKLVWTSDAAENKIIGISASLDRLTTRIDELQQTVASIPKDMVRRSDILKLCLGLERNNKDVRCPSDL